MNRQKLTRPSPTGTNGLFHIETRKRTPRSRALALALLMSGAPIAAAEPDDPLIDELWGMHKIQAPEAWDISLLDPTQDVVVVLSQVATH